MTMVTQGNCILTKMVMGSIPTEKINEAAIFASATQHFRIYTEIKRRELRKKNTINLNYRTIILTNNHLSNKVNDIYFKLCYIMSL